MPEIREVAEIVLHGESIAEKLTPLRDLTDVRPGATTVSPVTPGRPASLRRRAGGSSERFPSLAELEGEAARARMLHFLANHELLALELMALVLLRFPAAPRGFRRGIAAIMTDEQRHLSMYVERMQRLGTGFGDLDVGWFFWDALRDVATPDAFTAGMNLTLEQANLDHAAALAGAMARVGDDETRAILETVLADEVRHVRHGAERLDRRAGESQWNAWRRSAPPALAPANARGRPFRRDLRSRAGLDEAFIDRLEVAPAARPRRPGVWWFDPGCEEELAGEGGGAARAVGRALETLPLLLAREGDLVVTSRPVEDELVARLRALDLGRAAAVRAEDVGGREPVALRPWGVSPGAARLAGRMGCADLLPWDDAMAAAYRKSHAVRVARAVRQSLGDDLDPRVTAAENEGVVAASVESVDRAVRDFLAAGRRPVAVKADFKTAGRGTDRLREPPTRRDLERFDRLLAAHGALVVEPWLDRVLDLSTQMTVTPSGVRVDGVVRFETDGRGAFLGAWASPSHRGLAPELARFVAGDREVGPIGAVLRAFAEPAARSAAALGFAGPVAVDALIHRDRDGGLALRPLVELNPRLTMGRIALELGRRIARDAPGYWLVATRARLERAFPDGVAALLAAWPPAIERGPSGPRLVAGILPTSSTREDATLLTLLAVGEAALVLANG